MDENELNIKLEVNEEGESEPTKSPPAKKPKSKKCVAILPKPSGSKAKSDTVKEHGYANEAPDPTNPWSYLNGLSELLTYVCPEEHCRFGTKEIELIAEHAKEKHEARSKVFFEKIDHTFEIPDPVTANIILGNVVASSQFEVKLEPLDDAEAAELDDEFLAAEIKKKEEAGLTFAEQLDAELKKPKETPCRSCDTVCPSPFEMVTHWLTKHSDYAKICRYCPHVSLTPQERQEHHNKDHPLKTKDEFLCDKCLEESGVTFVTDTEARMKVHYKEKHDTDVFKGYLCPVEGCGKSLGGLGYLKAHVKGHENSVPPKQIKMCEICGTEVKNLRIHMEGSHPEEYFQSRQAKKKEKVMIKCKDCDYETHMHRNLTNHRRSHHELDKHVQCKICDKKFAWKSNMLIHMDEVHANELTDPQIVCQDCGAGFCIQYSFDKHKKKGLCGLSKSAKVARTHLKTPLKSLTCEHCHTLVHMSKLKSHTREQHPDMPLKALNVNIYDECAHCDSIFLTKSGKIQHMFRSHGVNLLPNYCAKCKVSYHKVHNCSTKKQVRVQVKCRTCKKKVSKSRIHSHMAVFHGQPLPDLVDDMDF